MSFEWLETYSTFILISFTGAVGGMFYYLKKWESRLGIVGFIALASLVVFYCFVFPVGLGWGVGRERHLLVIPLIATLMLPLVFSLRIELSANIRRVAVLILLASLIPTAKCAAKSIESNLQEAWHVYKYPKPYLYIMQRELAGWVNQHTPKSAVILMFEIEARYLMQRRMIDMEGYMGGNALPYVRPEGGGDFAKFLHKYRPDYWVVDESIIQMPMFRSTIYGRAFGSFLPDTQKMQLGPIGASYQESGVTFTLVKLPPLNQVTGNPLWAYKGVVKIEYQGDMFLRQAGDNISGTE